MKGSEVLKALEEGKKMRIVDWRQHEYIHKNENNEIVDEEDIEQDMLGINIFLKGEWEEFKEQKFKVGDWIACDTENGTDIMKITCEIDDCFDIDNGYGIKTKRTTDMYYRKATDEEIKQELERRKWKSIGRELREFKVDDIVISREDEKLYVITDNDCGEFLKLTYHLGGLPIYLLPKFIKLVCPVENRFDK